MVDSSKKVNKSFHLNSISKLILELESDDNPYEINTKDILYLHIYSDMVNKLL